MFALDLLEHAVAAGSTFGASIAAAGCVSAIVAVADAWITGGGTRLGRFAEVVARHRIKVQASPAGMRAGTVDGWHTVALVRESDGTGAPAMIGVDPDAALLDAHGFTDPSIAPDGRHATCDDQGQRVLVEFRTVDGIRTPVVVGSQLTG